MPVLQDDLHRLGSIGISEISSHVARCCAHARRVVLGHFDQWSDLGSQLAAIPALIHWGPTHWPVHWCELGAQEKPTGDCGVHADLAASLLARAGRSFLRGRAALKPSRFAPAHWRSAWSDAEADDRWIGSELVHHEVLRIEGRWWDPSEARWFSGPGDHVLSGRVEALRTEDGTWQFAPHQEVGAP